MELNNRFVINTDKYSFLPINLGEPSLSTDNNCKDLTIKNTMVLIFLVKVLVRQAMGF